MTAHLRTRVKAAANAFVVLFIIVLGRAFYLCVVTGGSMQALASQQQRRRAEMLPERGTIVDRRGDILALSMGSAQIYVHPARFRASGHQVGILAAALGMPPEMVEKKLESSRPRVWLHRRATPEQATAVAALGLPGVGNDSGRVRAYPHGALAGQVLGFAGIDEQGQAGLEYRYDGVLRGTPVSVTMQRDARGRGLLTESGWQQDASRQGGRLELTLDSDLQLAVERDLEAAVTEQEAAAGQAIVMDPVSGAILALAAVPSFDPNSASRSTAEQWRNRVVTDVYEPGSTFKAILAAAALEAGVIRSDDMVHCGNGAYVINRQVIHDHEPYGLLPFSDVIKYSSNIGTAKVGARLGEAAFRRAIAAFGFGKRTGVDLPDEASGLLPADSKWSPISLATTSFGQGISVTSMQLLRAYSAIANGGKLMRPYLVRRVVAADGTVLQENQPHVDGTPVSPKTAAVLTEMLRGVVDTGTATRARIDGFAVAGKTGTAQQVDPTTGRYSTWARMSSFVGYVPAEAPRFAILVLIDRPRRNRYGGLVAAPVFKRIAEYALAQAGLNVPPNLVPNPVVEKPVVQLASWAAPDTRRGMPSFIGLSMREAMVLAARAGWMVEFQGSGYVVSQDPPAGSEVVGGSRLLLQFGASAG